MKTTPFFKNPPSLNHMRKKITWLYNCKRKKKTYEEQICGKTMLKPIPVLVDGLPWKSEVTPVRGNGPSDILRYSEKYKIIYHGG